MIDPDAPIEPTDTGCKLHLYVRPRASRTKVAGLHGARVKLQVTAPPVDGEANAAIIAFLAKALGASKSSVAITSGHSGKRKTVAVEGVTADEAAQALGL